MCQDDQAHFLASPFIPNEQAVLGGAGGGRHFSRFQTATLCSKAVEPDSTVQSGK